MKIGQWKEIFITIRMMWMVQRLQRHERTLLDYKFHVLKKYQDYARYDLKEDAGKDMLQLMLELISKGIR